MSQINIKKDDFPDILVMFMLDYIMSDDMDIDNIQWEKFILQLEKLGIKVNLVKYYIGINATKKTKYKSISGIFRDKSKNKATINIIDKDVKNKKQKTSNTDTKQKIKKVLKLVREYRNKRYGMPLTEDIIDNIIDKVIGEDDE